MYVHMEIWFNKIIIINRHWLRKSEGVISANMRIVFKN